MALAILASLLAFVFMAIPVHATANPDSTPTIDRARVYHNLLETNDFLLIFEANIPYAVLPATSEPNTFIWRMVGLDGVTELGSTTGYAYNTDGYRYNVYSMYFSASTVATKGIVWGTDYIIRLVGNPTVFVTVPIYNFAINPGDYTTETTSDANKAALVEEIIFLASDLNNKWVLTTDYRLTLETEMGTVLSIYGEDVFRGSVYGVQALAPAAFRFIIQDISAAARSFNGSYNASLEGQYAGTWVDASRNASRDLLGTSYDLTSIVILLGACVALVLINLSVTSDHWNGIIDVCFLLVIGARMGIFSLVYLILIAALAVIFIGTKVWRMIPT
jgi:hypothetical protein